MRRSFRLNAWALLAMPIFGVGSSQAQMRCPPMPDNITQVNHDINVEVKAGVGALWKVGAADIGLKTDVVAKNVFDKYPNADRVVVVEMMTATYCPMIRGDKTLSDAQKRQLWLEFQDRVLKFENPSYSPAQTPKSKPNITKVTPKQSSSHPNQSGNSEGPKADSEQPAQASNCTKSDQTITNSVYRTGANPDLSGCRQEVRNNLIQRQENRPPLTLTISGEDTTLTQNTITDTNIDITKDAKNTQLNKNLTGYGDTVGPNSSRGLGTEQKGAGAETNKIYEAQTANVLKCVAPCGPHGPYPDAQLEGIPEGLPNARALTGSSRVLAERLSPFIDEGNALISRFLKDDDAEVLATQASAWKVKVEQLVSSALDPRLVKALSQVNSKQLGAMNTHNQKGIDICNSVKAKIDLLTMFYNQLLGVGD